ncbi:hypothetical protein VTO73DRAFT_11878 [Trametes versicolor]
MWPSPSASPSAKFSAYKPPSASVTEHRSLPPASLTLKNLLGTTRCHDALMAFIQASGRFAHILDAAPAPAPSRSCPH